MASKKKKSIAWENRIVGYEVRPARSFRAHEQNARRHPNQQRAALRGSLASVGWVLPVLENVRTGKLLDGHARIEEALLKSEDHLVPVIQVDVAEDEESLILATLDPITAMANYDKEALDALLRNVSTGDAALQSLLSELATANGLYNEVEITPGAGGDEFDVTPGVQQTRVKAGDLWQLGQHRLLVGDSTNADDVCKLMNGERAVLFATDPPYLVDYTGLNHPQNWGPGKKNKSKDWSDTYHDWDKAEAGEGLYDGFIAMAIEHAIVPNAAWYCWHASRKQSHLGAVWEKHGAFVHQQIIWFKTRAILTYSLYLWAHEPCFFGWIKGQKPARHSDEHPKTVWEIPSSEVESSEHPTSKPIELFAIPMRMHTQPGDLCYEPFCGSGSQLIAAERLKRRCYAMEREPNYGEVIVRRWEAETGQQAVLLERNDGHEEKLTKKRPSAKANAEKARQTSSKRAGKGKAATDKTDT